MITFCNHLNTLCLLYLSIMLYYTIVKYVQCSLTAKRHMYGRCITRHGYGQHDFALIKKTLNWGIYAPTQGSAYASSSPQSVWEAGKCVIETFPDAFLHHNPNLIDVLKQRPSRQSTYKLLRAVWWCWWFWPPPYVMPRLSLLFLIIIYTYSVVRLRGLPVFTVGGLWANVKASQQWFSTSEGVETLQLAGKQTSGPKSQTPELQEVRTLCSLTCSTRLIAVSSIGVGLSKLKVKQSSTCLTNQPATSWSGIEALDKFIRSCRRAGEYVFSSLSRCGQLLLAQMHGHKP